MVPANLAPGDYPELASFLEQQTGGAIDRAVWADRFECLWERNPSYRSDRFPRGWVLRDAAGSIGGFLGSVPRRYAWKGRDVTACATTSWYVRPDLRRFSLLLLREFIAQPCPLLNTTPVANTETVFLRCGFQSLAGDWIGHEFLAPANPGAFARFLAQWRQGLGRLSRLAFVAAAGASAASALRRASSVGSAGADASLREASAFSDEFDDLWRSAGSSERMTAVRDSEQLNWIYFSSPLLKKERRIFEVRRDGRLAGYFGVKVVTSGSTGYWEVADAFLPGEDARLLNRTLRLLLETARREPNLALVRLRGATDTLAQAARRCGFFRKAAPSGMLCKGAGFDAGDRPDLSPFDGDRPFFS